MNRIQTLKSAVAIATLGMLAACGGGEDEAIPPASPEMVQSFNALADHCGAGVTLPSTDTAETLNQLDARSVTRDRVSYTVTTAYAVNGFTPVNDNTWPMPMPLADLRGLTTGPYVSPGLAYPEVKMGVFIQHAFPPAGITCVMGIAGMRENRDGTRTAVRSSREGALDLSGLPGPAVNGFEWVANFTPALGVAAFTMRKESVDPGTARICQRASGMTAWNCSVPVVSASTTSFTFKLEPAVPGVYVLVAEK